MEIEYRYRFGLPRNLVWKLMKNEKILKDALPGCRSFEETSSGVYKAEIDVKIGPIQDVFTLDIHLDEEKAPSLVRLHLQGDGNMGQMNGYAILMFNETPGSTQLTCKANGQVTGALGLVGNRVIDSGATKGLEGFFQRLEKEIKRTIYELKRRNR